MGIKFWQVYGTHLAWLREHLGTSHLAVADVEPCEEMIHLPLILSEERHVFVLQADVVPPAHQLARHVDTLLPRD
jgi:hypothetical protein